MAVPSTSMISTARSLLARLRDEHGAKALRYCGVSVVNVATGMTTLAICHAVFGWPAVVANLTAWLVSTIPAYLLSRAWVWQQNGTHRVGGEVLPFWVIALIGLAFSSFVVGLVAQYTDRTLFILVGNLGAYGVVWVGKYLFLDKVMWRDPTTRAEPVEVG